jgi:hypothetical protein
MRTGEQSPLPGAAVVVHSLTHLLPLRSAQYSSATLDFDRQTSSANGAFGRQDRHDSTDVSAVKQMLNGAAVEVWQTARRVIHLDPIHRPNP